MHPTVTNHATRWKMALALLMAAFLIGMAATMVIAARRVTPVTDADYYNRGLHYDQTATGSKNPGLGWTMAASLAGAELQVRVKDQSGAPVAGGKLRFEPKRAGAGVSAPLVLAESAPGIFLAPRPVSPQGELHGTLRFTRGEAAASQKLVLFN
ncbi:MAG: nitrogen fixation protein FixH [Geobacteraceae bacterium GWC2_58_44]|nr:MAG: nitrogen fixation protein FixH [Geobacteraceae bacterium GWC2_58_44]HBG06405.1 nitrogen fixation protein FixH [Geobacter sp.]